MTDSQWRRYQVFLQENEGDPYQDAGSIHAPDPEMALLNARDVFARRPSCNGLWVVPVEVISDHRAASGEQGIKDMGLVTSDQESAIDERENLDNPLVTNRRSPAAESEKYYVFIKTKQAGAQTLAGEVLAGTPAEALQVAKEKLMGEKTALAWWVFPARLVIRTTPQDIESMFAPALDKPFRLSTGFRTVSAMREIKSGSTNSSRRPKRS
jgi:ring-1,2-phenylacetyl-CoA epoxidase subunit PaaB